MKVPVAAACLGSSLLFAVHPASAGVVEWTDADTRTLTVSWSSDAAKSLLAYLAVDKARVLDDIEGKVGPGGGILLTGFNRTSIEVDAVSGVVYAITVNKEGAVRIRRPLIDLFAGAPNRFEKNADDRKTAFHVVVTAEVTDAVSSAPLLVKGAGARKLLTFDVVVYGVKGGASRIVDQTSLAFDAVTLEPAIAPKAVRRYAEVSTEEPVLYYWSAKPAAYWYASTLNYWGPSSKQ